MLASTLPLQSAKLPLRIAFDGSPASEEPAALSIPAPWLAGASCENLFPHATLIPAVQGVQLYRAGGLLLGYAREPLTGGSLAAPTESLYRRLLTACRGRHLFRIWNYVPHINAHTAGSENYRAFCLGRARAFEGEMGPAFEAHLPAASAVGSQGNQLDLVFVAGAVSPHHFENPEQVPAYRYPLEHGPRSPCFARATVAHDGTDTLTFVSGTAAIKGHQTIAPGVLDAQLDCTLDNLRLVSQAAGLGDRFSTGAAARRHFKIYLRHPQDLRATRTRLEASLLLPGDTVTYLHAEICRAALNVEIEATIVQSDATSGSGTP